MATLTSRDTGRIIALRPIHLVGRAAGLDLVLTDPRASTTHAQLAWSKGVWTVRDLGSRNGTTLDGVPVARPRTLPLGATLAFAGEAWTVSDVAPPQVFAEAVDTGELRQAREGYLSLPDDDEPEAVVTSTGTAFVLERADESVDAYDREVVRIGSRAWRLHLPSGVGRAPETLSAVRELSSLRLRFSVSRDQETIGLVVSHAPWEADLGQRAHHEVLLLLARARRRDAALEEGEQGWVYQDALERDLHWSGNQLYLAVHRVRRQLAEAGVDQAAAIVERRPRTRQLRLGVPGEATEEVPA